MTFPKRVLIRELSPREGFQALAEVLPLSQKRALIEALSESGLSEIEVTSFVKPDKVPQLADSEELVSSLAPPPGVTYRALCLNEVALRKAVKFKQLKVEGWIYSAASDDFLSHNANTSQEKILQSIPKLIAAMKELSIPFHGVMISTSFGTVGEGPFNLGKFQDSLVPLIERLRAEGVAVKEISIADTTGMATPERLTAILKWLKVHYLESIVSCHFHDTKGFALLNTYIALHEGVSIFETSLGGLGGCPFTAGSAGNVPTEEVVALCDDLGIETGVSLPKLREALAKVPNIAGRSLPGRMATQILGALPFKG